MEASAINQRNLLPRLAVGGAIFYGDRHLLPLLTPPATLPRRPSQYALLLSLSRFFRPFYFLMRILSPRRSAILFGREFGDCSGSIARKARVSHTFLLVSVPPDISPEQPESTKGRDRGQPPSPREYPPVFCIILILCATPREETRNKRPRDNVACSRRPFTFSKIKRECLSVMLHGNSLAVARGGRNSIGIS